MKPIPVIFIFLSLIFPLSAQVTTFASRVDGESLTTKLTLERFSGTTPPSLYKVEKGQFGWAVEATVTEHEAALTAIEEAKRILGDRYGKEWTLREGGRQVSGYNRKYFHHYRFEFKPEQGGENLQILVTLDGRLVPLTRNK